MHARGPAVQEDLQGHLLGSMLREIQLAPLMITVNKGCGTQTQTASVSHVRVHQSRMYKHADTRHDLAVRSRCGSRGLLIV